MISTAARVTVVSDRDHAAGIRQLELSRARGECDGGKDCGGLHFCAAVIDREQREHRRSAKGVVRLLTQARMASTLESSRKKVDPPFVQVSVLELVRFVSKKEVASGNSASAIPLSLGWVWVSSLWRGA